MPRRNNRQGESYQPVDMTPPPRSRNPFVQRPDPIQPGGRVKSQAELEQERANRQRAARMKLGIDWSLCVVPGCGEELLFFGDPEHRPGRRDPSLELPICHPHAAVVWRQMVSNYVDDPKFIEAIADVNERVAEREMVDADERKRHRKAMKHGDIYFIRLNDLVKVGWTRDLWGRVKSYGASAQLLVAYPGTRDDETNLHRQLRPALAKGREWYEDGSIIGHFIDEALAKYGQPPSFDAMWTQPKRIVAGKRAARFR